MDTKNAVYVAGLIVVGYGLFILVLTLVYSCLSNKHCLLSRLIEAIFSRNYLWLMSVIGFVFVGSKVI